MQPFLKNYMLSAQQLNDCSATPDPAHTVYKIPVIGVENNEEIKITRSQQEFIVKAIEAHHKVPAVGYIVYAVRKRLKEEYKSLKGPEIGKLHKQGVEVNEVVRVPLFAYLGDTLISIYTAHPEILEVPVVITECTFLYPEHYENAIVGTHIHWDDLKLLVEKHPHITFVLMHFSPRYKQVEIVNFFKTVCEGGRYPNLVPWVSENDPY